MPADRAGGIVHGDYRLGNAITGEDGTIRAILDWELVTLGAPLADVGMMAAFWDPPADAMLGTRMPTAAPGAISVGDALEHYARLSGTDLGDIAFYQAFACWRLAATGLRSWARYESGAMGEAYDTSKFITAAGAWLDYARLLLASRLSERSAADSAGRRLLRPPQPAPCRTRVAGQASVGRGRPDAAVGGDDRRQLLRRGAGMTDASTPSSNCSLTAAAHSAAEPNAAGASQPAGSRPPMLLELSRGGDRVDGAHDRPHHRVRPEPGERLR